MNSQPSLAVLLLVVTGCASSPELQPGPTIDIPVFAANDARVGQPGFVAETCRLSREQGGIRYTLMAFRVGDTWTLGAMLRGGDFTGEVQWRVGERRLRIPFVSAKPGEATAVVVEPPAPDHLVAQGASFRGTAWTNVELSAPWLSDGLALQLQFVAADGSIVALPDAGVCYAVRSTPR